MENRIAELRKGQGLTLKALAERIGTSNQQISHLEKGRRRLTLDWTERTAIALNCEPFDLVSDGTRCRHDLPQPGAQPGGWWREGVQAPSKGSPSTSPWRT
jgi:transcriptional regulator with XRE-family HTH domain